MLAPKSTVETITRTMSFKRPFKMNVTAEHCFITNETVTFKATSTQALRAMMGMLLRKAAIIWGVYVKAVPIATGTSVIGARVSV